MTSKEALEIFLKLVDPQDENEWENCQKAHIKLKQDLDELEEIKKIMGTPIQDIMKRIKVLDIIQNYAIKYDNCVCIDAIFYDEEVKEWCK